MVRRQELGARRAPLRNPHFPCITRLVHKWRNLIKPEPVCLSQQQRHCSQSQYIKTGTRQGPQAWEPPQAGEARTRFSNFAATGFWTRATTQTALPGHCRDLGRQCDGSHITLIHVLLYLEALDLHSTDRITCSSSCAQPTSFRPGFIPLFCPSLPGPHDSFRKQNDS